ncbi:MAG TPA: DUF2510 domain-containing protein [Solirubrobacterales bacterium]|nr:DUF2510 domain-containing protein [Solirubrobacterales bacterium]
MNSTETPGGSGIPAGWYDDPSGQGLRWWDGEQWTEHVHTAESAAAAADTGSGAGEREAPPPELVKLRESIRAKGAKGVGMALGGLVLVIVVIALLVSGGSDDNGNAAQPGNATPTAAQPVLKKQIKALRQQLHSPNLPKAEKKALEQQLKALEKEAGGGSQGGKSGAAGESSAGK